MKVYFYTLGCKVNQYETQALSESLRRAGYEVTSDSMGADIYIVNSCTVTSVSDQKTRQAVRRFKRQNPQAVVVLTGCMPQAYPQQALKLLSADIVLGNKNNSELIDLLNRYFEKKDRVVSLSQHMGFGTESDMKISSFL
ncbi:MAG: tRNA (N(6)-L-threonylcarbamoyladenosine(37)-C(2))-methylthiotransferase MtaB, partial [Oscillospiraceae bacterium]|nr:tRNA (N(6)-L-threonylcarbamoyladenosine(37)-C(2))-methylthiotransferase MtaB [Oscillospiraceae bacterium]